eukprot:UN02648
MQEFEAECIIAWQWRINNKDWMRYNHKLTAIVEKLQINESYIYSLRNNKTYKITKTGRSSGIEQLISGNNYTSSVSWPLRRTTRNKYQQQMMEKRNGRACTISEYNNYSRPRSKSKRKNYSHSNVSNVSFKMKGIVV